MECRDVRELADSFLAEQLLTETSHAILRHLATCPMCRADLAARRTLRESLRRAFQGAPGLEPSSEFIEQLRTRLHGTVGRLPARRRIMFRGWWALAATVLLAAAIGVTYRGRDWLTATGTLARAAVGDHRDCALQFRLAEKPITFEEAARRYGSAPYRVLEKLPPGDVMTTAGPAKTLERHVCIYQGRRFAHVVFEYRGQLVSLLVTAADGGVPLAVPDEALPHVTSARRVDQMSVVSFRTSRYAVFFAGDVAPTDLAALADVIAGPLYRELAEA
jgi:hypothetical protein